MSDKISTENENRSTYDLRNNVTSDKRNTQYTQYTREVLDSGHFSR